MKLSEAFLCGYILACSDMKLHTAMPPSSYKPLAKSGFSPLKFTTQILYYHWYDQNVQYILLTETLCMKHYLG